MMEIYPPFTPVTIDTNVVDTVTSGIDVSSCDQITFYISDVTGTHGTHIITLQFSHEDETGSYQDSTHTKTGLGCKQVVDIKSVAWIRLKVTTPEGAVSTSKVCMDASRNVRRFCR